MPPRVAVRSALRPTTIPNTRVSSVNVREPDISQPVSNFGFETTMSYSNGFPYPVVVSLRNGLAVTIPPIADNWASTRDFVVYVRFRFAKDVKIDTHRILDVISDNSSMELKSLKEAIIGAKVNIVRNGHECLLMYTIERSVFEEHRGAIYVHSLDVALSSDNAERPVFHPESEEGRQIREQYALESGLNYHVVIVDKDRRYGKRWVNIGGRVFSINPIYDSTRLDGVYLTTSSPEDHCKLEEVYYTFEAATAELMLFQSESDASTLGDQSETRKREFEMAQHEQKLSWIKLEGEHKQQIQSLELQLAKQKQEKADRESELSKEVAALKKSEYALEKEASKREAKYAKEKAAREARMLDEKDYYEHRSYARKDSSEIVKWLPAAVVGVGLLISKFL